jgi:hypothetical protein
MAKSEKDTLPPPDLGTHPLVLAMQALGTNDPPIGLVALTGYFGPSKKANSIRLYTSPEFQSYYEIPTGAIKATSPADSANPLGPTVAYVEVGTQVELVQTGTKPVEDYLQGGITAGYFAGASSGGYPGTALQGVIPVQWGPMYSPCPANCKTP